MTASSVSQTAVKPRVGRIAIAVMVMLLGTFIIGMIGFSHIEVVHNAAHDTRHSFAFPCH